MKDRRDRELSFPEWRRLSHRKKREIMVQRWNPGDPLVAETRAAILEGFGAANPQLLEKAIAATAFSAASDGARSRGSGSIGPSPAAL